VAVVVSDFSLLLMGLKPKDADAACWEYRPAALMEKTALRSRTAMKGVSG
jgi:hypothetical protein